MSTSPALRFTAAACLVLTGLGMVVSTALIPPHGDDNRAAIDHFAAAPGRVSGALTADVVVVIFGAAIAVAALLVRPRYPRLAGVAAWLGIISGAAMVFLAGMDYDVQAGVGADRTGAVQLLDNLDQMPQVTVFLALALLGTVAATACLGVGLWLVRAVPRWTAAALVAYGPANILLANAGSVAWAAGNALLLIGLGACAVTILRSGFPRTYTAVQQAGSSTGPVFSSTQVRPSGMS